MQSPRPSVEAIFKKLDPEGTGMLTKQGVKEALSQMGMDSSEEAVEQIFRTASSDMASPKSFSNLVGKLKQQKASTEQASMASMKQRFDMEMQAERSKHRAEMENLARHNQEAQAMAASMSPQRSPGATSYGGSPTNALVPISNHQLLSSPSSYSGSAPRSALKKSPGSGYKMVTRGTASGGKPSYGNRGNAEPEPTGFMSPVTYNRKFNQLVSDMEVQTQLKVDEALRDQRDRHADALERVVAEKEAEMALRLSELARNLESRHAQDMNEKLAQTSRQAEEARLSLLQQESMKIDELLGDAEMYKIQTEAEITETTDKFKRMLSSQLAEQRESHAEELSRSLAEAEARATELRVSVISEKDKMFAAEKDALETRLRTAAASDLEMQQQRFEQHLADSLAQKAKEIQESAEREKEKALLEQSKLYAAKVENVESEMKLEHSQQLALTMGAASNEWETEREKIRLALAQEHTDSMAAQLEVKEKESRARHEAVLGNVHAEHRAAMASQLEQAEKEHAAQLRAQHAQLEEQHNKTLSAQLAAKETAHTRLLEQALAQRDEEHSAMLEATLRTTEAQHVERTQMLLAQHQDSTRSRVEAMLQSKGVDHDEHLVRVKEELAKGHQENLSRELAHQRDQLRRQYDAEKVELMKRLEDKRVSDIATQSADSDDAVARLTAELKEAHAQELAQVEAEWQAKREESIKASARNLHDMHQEALRRALYDKDREHEERFERLVRDKDAHHTEVMQQLAAQRDEEHHERLMRELEAMEAEHRSVMDQLVKEKLDADKHHRDETMDLKEHISQLESKMHINLTKSTQEVRQHSDRLGKFCEWVADQQISVAVETSMGYFKKGVIKVLDPGTSMAVVRFEDGDEETDVLLHRISFAPPKPLPAEIPPSSAALHQALSSGGASGGGGGGGESEVVTPANLHGVLSAMTSNERALMVFVPCAVFPAVVLALGLVLNLAYGQGE